MRLVDLTDDKIQELSNAIVRKIAMSQLPPLMKMELFLTEACNLRCDYCFVATKKAYRRMSWEVARAAIDFLMRESRDENRVEIVLFGGEPLLAFPLMKQVVEYAEQRSKDLGKQVSFACTTDGTLLTEEHVHFAKEHASDDLGAYSGSGFGVGILDALQICLLGGRERDR